MQCGPAESICPLQLPPTSLFLNRLDMLDVPLSPWQLILIGVDGTRNRPAPVSSLWNMASGMSTARSPTSGDTSSKSASEDSKQTLMIIGK